MLPSVSNITFVPIEIGTLCKFNYKNLRSYDPTPVGVSDKKYANWYFKGLEMKANEPCIILNQLNPEDLFLSRTIYNYNPDRCFPYMCYIITQKLTLITLEMELEKI